MFPQSWYMTFVYDLTWTKAPTSIIQCQDIKIQYQMQPYPGPSLCHPHDVSTTPELNASSRIIVVNDADVFRSF